MIKKTFAHNTSQMFDITKQTLLVKGEMVW